MPAMSLLSLDLDLRPYKPKINGFPGLVVKYFCVKFGILVPLVFEHRVEKQTDKHPSN